MGGIRRQRKKIVTPGHPYDKVRLERELPLVGEYGLRNKKELWKARTILSTARKQARTLLALDPEVRSQRENELLSRLSRFGLLPKGSDLDSVLSLDVQTVLERRLQTLVHRKGLAATTYQARQFIAHRHIALGDGVVTTPSRLITVNEEEKLNYAPRSSLNKTSHPSRPQAPPVIPEFEEQKKSEEKVKPKEEKPKAKPAAKPKVAPKEDKPKPAAKPKVAPKEKKPKPKPVAKPKVAPKEDKPKPVAKPKVEPKEDKPKPAAKPKTPPKEKKEEATPEEKPKTKSAAKPKATAEKKPSTAKKTTSTSSKKEESK